MVQRDLIQLKNHLKFARAEHRLNQSQLAKLVGVSRQTISNIETGEMVPNAKLALLLAITLEKNFEELFYLDVNETHYHTRKGSEEVLN